MELKRQALTDMYLPELLKGSTATGEQPVGGKVEYDAEISTGGVRQSRIVFRSTDQNWPVDADELKAVVAGSSGEQDAEALSCEATACNRGKQEVKEIGCAGQECSSGEEAHCLGSEPNTVQTDWTYSSTEMQC